MLNITVLAVGTVKETYLRDAIREYSKRLSAYCRLTFVECKEERLPDSPSPAEIRTAIVREGERLLASVPKRAYVVALCIEGKELSSEELADRISAITAGGYSELVFVIGGSDGLSDAVRERADLRLSFSRMTFPHQLMRVILTEQLYRAMNILGGGKYHK